MCAKPLAFGVWRIALGLLCSEYAYLARFEVSRDPMLKISYVVGFFVSREQVVFGSHIKPVRSRVPALPYLQLLFTTY